MLRTGDKDISISLDHLPNAGIAQQFPEINDPNQPNNAFLIQIDAVTINNKQLQIIAIGNDHQEYLSKIYFIE
jgi:hypothetical protein